MQQPVDESVCCSVCCWSLTMLPSLCLSMSFPAGGRQKDFVDTEKSLGRTDPAQISALVGYAGGQVRRAVSGDLVLCCEAFLGGLCCAADWVCLLT